MLPSQLVDVVLEEEADCSDKWGKKCKPTLKSDLNSKPNDALVASLELKKKLPDAFLSECTIEICKDPRQKKAAPKLNFEVQITPVYKYNQKREKGVVEAEEPEVHDILSEVEAVYSEHESDDEPDDLDDPGDDLDEPGDDLDDPPTSETTVTTSGLHGLTQVVTNIQRLRGDNSDKRPQFKPTFRCEHCPNVYGNRGALWQHSVAAHSVRKNCQCAICGRRFYRNCSLALHLKSHHNDQQHLLHLQQQQQHQQRSRERSLSCPECGKEFDTGEALDVHLVDSHDTLPTPPQASGGASSPQGDQVQSSAVSSAAIASRPYQCQYCKKCYSQKSVLKKHLVIHTGERLTCALCGIDFTQKSSLLRHVKRMHSASGGGGGGGGITSTTGPARRPRSPADPDCLPSVQSFMQNIKIPQGISISMVD